jgi:YHS domain-containing protein
MCDDKRSGRIRIRAAVGAAPILALTFLALAASAEEVVNTGYFGDVAIKGYDTVAYFTENRAVEGSPRFSHRWLGATWLFSSAENRDLFASQPVKYAPQYGGHCADGVSLGTITTNIDPKAWRIIEGKLYLSYDPGAADGFAKAPAKVVNSQKYWPEVNKTLLSEKLQKRWE